MARGKGGGPKTPNGKKTASENSTQHGLTSKKLFVGPEKAEDLARLEEGWLAAYEHKEQPEKSLLDEVILADWRLRRAERNYAEVEAAIGEKSALEWTEEEHEKLQLFLRYRTTAERTFYRAFSATEAKRRTRLAEEHAAQRMRIMISREIEQNEEKERARKEREASAGEQRVVSPKEDRWTRTPDSTETKQWITVRTEDGRTQTIYNPSNEALAAEIREKGSQAQFVRRLLTFKQGVPEEYAWAKPPVDVDPSKECGAQQRMTVETWFAVVEREARKLDGHVGEVEEEW